jgi:hypothetical protein
MEVLLGILAGLDVRGCTATGRGSCLIGETPRPTCPRLLAGLLTDLMNGSSR